MSFTPKDSPIKLTPEQEAEINSCSPEQIVPLMHAFMLANGNAKINADGENEVVIGPAASAREFIQTIEINGADVTVRGASELELAKNVTEGYRTQSQTPTQKRGADGKFVAEAAETPMPADDQELQAAVADLRMQMVRNEIIPEEFLSKKAELESGLAMTRQWQQATEIFRNSDAGSDWIGGDQNRALLVGMMQHLDLMEGEEVDTVEKKTAVLAALWQQMKSSGNYFEAEVSPAELAEKLADQAIQEQTNEEYAKEIAQAKSATEVAEINTRYGFRPERTSTDWR